MSEPEPPADETPPAEPSSPPAGPGAASGLSEEDARLAYGIVQTLLEHARVLSDLVALMAQVLDADTTKALTETPHWNAYLDSRRAMERARADLERFAEVWSKL